MLKNRLIACLLWNNGMLIQSKHFRHTNSVGSAYTAIDFFNTWAIDEIVLLDVSRDQKNREQFHTHLKELSIRCFVPLAVGGWITSLEEMRTLLIEGADKVVLNTEAFKNHDLLRDAAKRFGNQCCVVSIDVKTSATLGHEVYVNRGRDATGTSAVEWATMAQELGAGEIFLTSIDRDGTQQGYDLDLIRTVSANVNIPVIASGGVGNWQHMIDGIHVGANAISAANIFHYSDQSTKKAKNELFSHGINVRKPEFYDVQIPRKVVYRPY